MGSGGRVDGRTTDTRARIEAVALQRFNEQGFSATSLRDIANDLGITKAAIYYHFPAKADLGRAIFQPFIDDIDAVLQRAQGGGLSSREVLERFFDAVVPHRLAFAATVRDASVLKYVDLESAMARWFDRFPRLLFGGDPTDEQRIRAVVAVGGLSRSLLLVHLAPERIRAIAVDAAHAALGPDAR